MDKEAGQIAQQAILALTERILRMVWLIIALVCFMATLLLKEIGLYLE